MNETLLQRGRRFIARYHLAIVFGIIAVIVWMQAEPEATAQFVWLVLVIIGSAVCGYARPREGWRHGVVLMFSGVVFLGVIGLVTGELFQSERSTGGLAGLFMLGGFVALLSPIGMLAANAGVWVANKMQSLGDESARDQ